MRRTAAVSAALVTLLVVGALTPVAGHTPDNGPPIRDAVEIVSISTFDDENDGWLGNTELEVQWEITQANGHPGSVGSREFAYTYRDANGDGIGDWTAVGHTMYTHLECEPFDEITVKLTVEEDDLVFDDDLGTDSATFAGPGTKTITTAGPDGRARIEVRVDVTALHTHAANRKCPPPYSNVDPGVEGEYAHATLHLASRLQEVDSFGTAALANERVEVRVDGEAVGVVTGEGGEIERVTLGGLSDPTVVATTDAATAEEIAHAEQPRDAVRQAVANGEITYRGVGPAGRVTSGLVGLYEGVSGAVGGFLGHVGDLVGL